MLGARQIWLAIVMLATAVPAGAQQKQQPSAGVGQLGSIHGTVSTAQDGVSSGVAGISVRLTPQVAGLFPQSADTDEAGHYEFKGVRPGTYTVSLALQGFKAVSQPVNVAAGQAAVQDISLELETVTEKVEVQEQNQDITTESVSAPAGTISQRELTSLPTPQERVREVLPVTPGVIKTQDGKLSLRGADENQSLLLVNSARTTDPVSGSFSVPIPTDAVQSFAVYKTPYNAGLGSFAGGLTAVETKPPEERWNYKVKNFVPSVLGKNGSMVGLSEALPGVDFGGPIWEHKLFFSEVFQYEMKKYSVRGLPWPDDISKKQGFSSFSTLEAVLSPRHIVTFTANVFPSRWRHFDANSLVPLTASNDLDQKGASVAASDRYQFSSGAIFSAIAQYTRFDSNAHGQGSADMLINPEGYGGDYFNQWSRRGKEFQLVPAYQFSEKHWHGRHELHVGVDFDHRSFTGFSATDPIQLLREDGTLAETINFQGTVLQATEDTAVAEFVQDHWVLNPHWALDVGARVSSETRGWAAAFAPRAGVAYSPGSDGKTVIRAGAGVFYNLLPLLASDFSQNPTRVVSMLDLNGVPTGLPVTYTNAYVGSANPLNVSRLPNQPGTTPRNFTWNMEVERELRSNLRLRVGYIDSHTTYLFVVNPFTAPTGSQSFLGLTNDGSSHYRELEATLRARFRKTDEINGSYIFSRTRGDLNNLSSVMIPFLQPVIRPNVYGILPYDVPHRVVVWGIFSLPKDFKFSPIADVHSGYPYSNIDTLQNYVGTANAQRFNPFFSLDVKIYRQFRVPFLGTEHGKKQHHIRLGFYSLNLTNHGNFHDVYNNVSSPLFGTFAGFQDRRDGAVIDFVD
jgi:Carboxypeptidase regulatory-like domain/TonB-dependent Receptor Plug Domain